MTTPTPTSTTMRTTSPSTASTTSPALGTASCCASPTSLAVACIACSCCREAVAGVQNVGGEVCILCVAASDHGRSMLPIGQLLRGPRVATRATQLLPAALPSVHACHRLHPLVTRLAACGACTHAVPLYLLAPKVALHELAVVAGCVAPCARWRRPRAAHLQSRKSGGVGECHAPRWFTHHD